MGGLSDEETAMERIDDYLRIRVAAEFLHPLNYYRLYRRSDLEDVLRRITRKGQQRQRTQRRVASEDGAVP